MPSLVKGKSKNSDGKGWYGNPILLTVIRIFFGVFFVFTGLLKVTEPRAELEAVISAYQLFPDGMIPYIALTLPWIEITLGTCLALGFLTIIASWCGAALLLGFTFALGYTVASGIDLKDCGCFGSIGLQQSNSAALIRNLILLAIYSLILLHPAWMWSFDACRERETSSEV